MIAELQSFITFTCLTIDLDSINCFKAVPISMPDSNTTAKNVYTVVCCDEIGTL